MAPAGLADDLAVVVHQQAVGRLAEVAAQQAPELQVKAMLAVMVVALVQGAVEVVLVLLVLMVQ